MTQSFKDKLLEDYIKQQQPYGLITQAYQIPNTKFAQNVTENAGGIIGNNYASDFKQKNGASIKDTAGNVAEGFIKGGLIGGIAELAKAQKNASKNAMKNAISLGKQTMQMGQDELQNAMKNAEEYNGITGGASPIFVGNAQPNQSAIEEYQNYLRNNGYSDNVANGVSQGLNSGYKEIDDWIKQYNAGQGQNNPINIPQTQEQIELARQGQFNSPSIQNDTQERQGFINKLANGLYDFRRGYQENKTTAFAPENMQSDKSKGLMNRLGEAVGTASRLAESPGVRGLIATGASALMGNPFALAQGYKFANEGAMSRLYQDALAKNGINADPGLFGTINREGFNALLTPQMKELDRQIQRDKLDETIRHYLAMEENQRMSAEARARDAQTREYKATHPTTINHVSNGSKSTGNSGNNKQASGNYVIMEAPNGKRYNVPVEKIKEYKTYGGKIVG